MNRLIAICVVVTLFGAAASVAMVGSLYTQGF